MMTATPAAPTTTYAGHIRRSDGATVTVTVTVPDDYPDRGEMAEVAQFHASRVDKLITRHREWAAKRKADMEAEDAPF